MHILQVLSYFFRGSKCVADVTRLTYNQDIPFGKQGTVTTQTHSYLHRWIFIAHGTQIVLGTMMLAQGRNIRVVSEHEALIAEVAREVFLLQMLIESIRIEEMRIAELATGVTRQKPVMQSNCMFSTRQEIVKK